MTGKSRRHYHCKALNRLLCADVPLRNYSLTHFSKLTCNILSPVTPSMYTDDVQISFVFDMPQVYRMLHVAVVCVC